MSTLHFDLGVEYDLAGVIHAHDNRGNPVEKWIFLSDFEPTHQSAYKNFRETLKQEARKFFKVHSIELCLVGVRKSVSTKQVFRFVSMKGSEDWLDEVEFFYSYSGSSTTLELTKPESFGLVDFKKGIRVEWSNGCVHITELRR